MIKRYIYLVLIIIWALVVFVFSNQPAEESSQKSGGITKQIVNIVTKGTGDMSQEDVDIIEKTVRKCAHFSIYCIGGICQMDINF